MNGYILIRMNRKFATVVLLLLAWTASPAQAVREVSVSGDRAFTDHLQLNQGYGDSDITVKIVFDEAGNMLTLSLISYRNIFVFHEDVVYKKVFCGAGNLKVNKLPYAVESEPGSKYKMPYNFRSKILGYGYKNITFHKWYSSTGLIPVPSQPRMINPFIEQKFTVASTEMPVTLTLRDILMVDAGSNPLHWKFTSWADLNIRYSVTITRNPCFGKEEEIASAQTSLEAVRTAYDSFAEHYSSGVVDTPESMDVFNEMKDLLQSQFIYHPAESSCPDVTALWEEYNTYVQAFDGVNCTLRRKGTDVEMLYEKARALDLYTARWLLTDDAVEKDDITNAAGEAIRQADEAIEEGGLVNEEQRKAGAVYRRARDYFKTNCKKR